MPRELVAISPRTPVLREYEEQPLGPDDVRIRTEFASPKHGTELVGYRNDPAAQRWYDRELGAVVTRQDGAHFPMRLGNMAVGSVVEVGSAVTRLTAGDRVFGHWPIRETHTASENEVDPMPAGLSDESAVCLDPAVMAFPMRDARIGLGDYVAVFRLGAIGLLAVQMARLAGAEQVTAIDPLPDRRQLAFGFGADHALDPRDGDVALKIRELTRSAGRLPEPSAAQSGHHVVGGYREQVTQFGELGVDVAVEVSGNVRALHDAIRSTRFGGTVCVLSYYSGDSRGLFLGEEFHINRLQLVSARAQSLPSRDAPGWNLPRPVDTCLAWLVSGRMGSSRRSSRSRTRRRPIRRSTSTRSGRSNWGSGSTKPVDPEQVDIVVRSVGDGQVGQNFADYRRELVAVPGAGRRHDHRAAGFQPVDHEVLVRGIGEQAGRHRQHGTVRVREEPPDRLPEHRFVLLIWHAIPVVGIHDFVPVVVLAELEAGDAVDREAVVAVDLGGQVEDRKPLGFEVRGCPRLEPSQHLALRLGEGSELGQDFADPRPGAQDQLVRLIPALGSFDSNPG
jgi:threonine dehydrogenase-like Zn-dependent dehydrogenase